MVAVLYINEAIPGKLINLYDFKEESEILLFEFRNYKPPSLKFQHAVNHYYPYLH